MWAHNKKREGEKHIAQNKIIKEEVEEDGVRNYPKTLLDLTLLLWLNQIN